MVWAQATWSPSLAAGWIERLSKWIAQKIFKLKIEAHPVNACPYLSFKHRISFATYLAANFGCYQFRIMPDIVSMLLHDAIWSCCAVQLEFEQTPFSRIGRHQFRSAALHRIQFGTCCFVPVSYFYSETNHWSEDGQSNGHSFGLQQLLANSIKNFISHHKKSDLLLLKIFKSWKPCWLSNWVSITRVGAHFPQASRLLPAATAAYSETVQWVRVGKPSL